MSSFGQPFAKSDISASWSKQNIGQIYLLWRFALVKRLGKVSQPAIWSGSALVSSGWTPVYSSSVLHCWIWAEANSGVATVPEPVRTYLLNPKPGFGLGPCCGLQVFMAPLFLGHLAPQPWHHSHSRPQPGQNSNSRPSASRMTSMKMLCSFLHYKYYRHSQRYLWLYYFSRWWAKLN